MDRLPIRTLESVFGVMYCVSWHGMLYLFSCDSDGTESVLPRAIPPPALPARGWLTLESPHFPSPARAACSPRGYAAEDAHRNLVPKMQYFPRRPMVIADITDANAFARVTPYNHITIHPYCRIPSPTIPD